MIQGQWLLYGTVFQQIPPGTGTIKIPLNLVNIENQCFQKMAAFRVLLYRFQIAVVHNNQIPNLRRFCGIKVKNHGWNREVCESRQRQGRRMPVNSLGDGHTRKIRLRGNAARHVKAVFIVNTSYQALEVPGFFRDAFYVDKQLT